MHTFNLELPVKNTMRTITSDLSDELHERVQKLAMRNKVSINFLVAAALAESRLIPNTEEYLAEQNKKKQAS